MFKHEESNRLIMHEESIPVDIKLSKAAIWLFEPKPALRVYQLPPPPPHSPEHFAIRIVTTTCS